MDILPINMADDAQGLLPAQYIDQANLNAYIGALAQTWQQIDDLIQQLQAGTSLDDAQGVQLDHIGALVGQQRLGGPYGTAGAESDASYRIKIATRTLANKSQGTIENMLGVITTLLGAQLTSANLVEVYPAGFALFLHVASPLSAQQEADVIEFVLASKPAGVRCYGIAPLISPVFAFEGYPSPPGAGYDVGAWADYIYP